jgi:hypothetical protein
VFGFKPHFRAASRSVINPINSSACGVTIRSGDVLKSDCLLSISPPIPTEFNACKENILGQTDRRAVAQRYVDFGDVFFTPSCDEISTDRWPTRRLVGRK